MALTYSEMIPLGKRAPNFKLLNILDKSHVEFKALAKTGKKAYVIMFICNHCPYVLAVQDRIAALAKEFTPKGVQFIGICSNDADQYPEDSPENLKKQAKDVGFDFPYLLDSSQDIAKAYGAVCTPDIFVFDQETILRYRGRIDDSWKDVKKVKTQDLKLALEALVNGTPLAKDQWPSMGCSIKWKNAKK